MNQAQVIVETVHEFNYHNPDATVTLYAIHTKRKSVLPLTRLSVKSLPTYADIVK